MKDFQNESVQSKNEVSRRRTFAAVVHNVCHWIMDILPLLFSVGFIVLGIIALVLDGKPPSSRALVVVDEVVKYV